MHLEKLLAPLRCSARAIIESTHPGEACQARGPQPERGRSPLMALSGREDRKPDVL
jgi:hypothetical protein